MILLAPAANSFSAESGWITTEIIFSCESRASVIDWFRLNPVNDQCSTVDQAGQGYHPGEV